MDSDTHFPIGLPEMPAQTLSIWAKSAYNEP